MAASSSSMVSQTANPFQDLVTSFKGKDSLSRLPDKEIPRQAFELVNQLRVQCGCLNKRIPLLHGFPGQVDSRHIAVVRQWHLKGLAIAKEIFKLANQKTVNTPQGFVEAMQMSFITGAYNDVTFNLVEPAAQKFLEHAYKFDPDGLGRYPLYNEKRKAIEVTIKTDRTSRKQYKNQSNLSQEQVNAIVNFAVEMFNLKTTAECRIELQSNLGYTSKISKEQAEQACEPNLEGIGGVFFTQNVKRGQPLGVYSGTLTESELAFRSQHGLHVGALANDTTSYMIDGTGVGLIAGMNTCSQENDRGNEAPSTDPRFNVDKLMLNVHVKGRVMGKELNADTRMAVYFAKKDSTKGELAFSYYGRPGGSISG